MNVLFNRISHHFLRGSIEGESTTPIYPDNTWLFVRSTLEDSASAVLTSLERISGPRVLAFLRSPSTHVRSHNDDIWMVGVFASAACLFVGVCMYVHSDAGERRIQALLGMRRYVIPSPGTETVPGEDGLMQGTPTSISSASLPPSPHPEF